MNPEREYNVKEEESFFKEVKTINVSKNEVLYLNDSLTLILEHSTNNSTISIPARGISNTAGFAAPPELILRIGEAILFLTNPENTSKLTEIELTVSELLLIREACQSYILFNNEPVGYNLMRKIYSVLLGEHVKEKEVFNKLLEDINMSPPEKPKSSEEKINDITNPTQDD